MRKITLEVPDGVISVNATVRYKKKDQTDSQYCMTLIQIDTDNFSGARITESGDIAYMIRLKRKVTEGDTD